MKELGILSADNGAPYWIASRFVYEHNDVIRSYVNFELRYINGGALLEQTFCCVESYATSNIAYGLTAQDIAQKLLEGCYYSINEEANQRIKSAIKSK